MIDCELQLARPEGRKEPLAPPATGWTPVRTGAGIIRYGRGAALPGSAVIRYARRHLGFLVGLLLAGVVIGIAYRYVLDPLEEQTLPYYIRSCLHGVGLAYSGWAVLFAFAAVRRSRLAGVLRRLPLIVEFAVKALAMTAVLTIVAVGLEFVLYPTPPGQDWFADDLPRIVGIAFTVSLLVGAIFELRRLVGGRVLGSFLLGTYHRPKREQRIVMFLDIQSSTALAERMGELRVHDLITEFFFDIDRPIAEHGGEVHAYAGDGVIITWPLSDDSTRNARALVCFFAAEDRMAELTPAYLAEFGVAPRFHAGVHAGPVVISECGDAKRQIAYFGDTMNVAARLCDHCKSAEEALLVSADLLHAAAVPRGLAVGTGANIALRGRQAPVETYAVRRNAPTGQ
jgi:class 3 adenylate cyclase